MTTIYANTTAAALMAELKIRIEDGYAAARNATVAVAADPAHAMELLAGGRLGGVAVVIFYMGDAPLADESDLPGDTAIEGRLRVGVIRRTDMALKPTRSTPTALDEAEALRCCIANIMDAGTLTGGYEYGGMTYVSTATGELLHGYIMDYTALYAYKIPAIEE